MSLSFPLVIRQGCLYYVKDEKITFISEGKRTRHATRRPVLVVSRDNVNDEDSYEAVFVCPISSGGNSSDFDVKIAAFEGGQRKKSWVRVEHLQRLLKNDLEACLSQDGISAAALENVLANIAEMFFPR
ncbi:mRNA-degrading endonuclease toxin of MazEF toxin-antitoxin module [Pseudoglutamicibacter albus]|uniref:mRNA-degrading endonuclease toxin of MazEF toxin-antitoxin module n=1 Tax=Pseudoglutamicibacter albus TaxID=98671 RepID=A0ABU1YWZ1_9MICC|nr:type II toxin-antitoxin system PemK/MazF family toxin [Pseudoglutamicibacter albus]MDR7292874.1 mRNA-degrading endonuclease toxin of MazEF toxin-antitoxin module [Pseudoglutamicibacter albus]